jgi:hypothetical protein
VGNFLQAPKQKARAHLEVSRGILNHFLGRAFIGRVLYLGSQFSEGRSKLVSWRANLSGYRRGQQSPSVDDRTVWDGDSKEGPGEEIDAHTGTSKATFAIWSTSSK